MPETNARSRALHALRGLVGRYGLKVLGDPHIGQLAQTDPDLAPYGAMLEAFARAGLYERFREQVKQGQTVEEAVRTGVEQLAGTDAGKRAAAAWVCRANWRMMETVHLSRPVPQAQAARRARKPARSISLPSLKRKKKRQKRQSSGDGVNPLWATVLCVARILLGLALMAAVLYLVGAVSLLARMDGQMWQRLPQGVQQIILQAPQVSRELWTVEGLVNRPPVLEFVRLVAHRAWYPAVMACLGLWGAYLAAFAIPAAHQGQGLFRQMFGSGVALAALAVLSMLGMSALFAILMLW